MMGRSAKALGFGAWVLPLLLIAGQAPGSQTVIPLWPGGAPGSAPLGGAETMRITDGGEHIVSNVHVPSITAYLPPAARGAGAAVIVIPGGGHLNVETGYGPWPAMLDWCGRDNLAFLA